MQLAPLINDDDFDLLVAPEAEENTLDIESAQHHFSFEEEEARRTTRKRIMGIYAKHAPDKVANVDRLMTKYANALPQLVEKLEAKYASPARAAPEPAEARAPAKPEPAGEGFRPPSRDPLSESVLRTTGNRVTVLLLARGHTYGLPGTDGTMASNYAAVVANTHPLLAGLLAHALHPYSRADRRAVFACRAAANVAAAAGFLRYRTLGGFCCLAPPCLGAYHAAKYTVLALYGEFLRLVAGCPCLFAPFLEPRGIDVVAGRSARLARYRGRSRAAARLAVAAHALGVAAAVYYVPWVLAAKPRFGLTTRQFVSLVAGDAAAAEVVFSVAWFLPATVRFLSLYPGDRAKWHRMYAPRAVKAEYEDANDGDIAALAAAGAAAVVVAACALYGVANAPAAALRRSCGT